MVSQWRKALSRHSVIHSGSPFTDDSRRTTDSSRPGGNVSCSMSVTKPALYSALVMSSRDGPMAIDSVSIST